MVLDFLATKLRQVIRVCFLVFQATDPGIRRTLVRVVTWILLLGCSQHLGRKMPWARAHIRLISGIGVSLFSLFFPLETHLGGIDSPLFAIVFLFSALVLPYLPFWLSLRFYPRYSFGAYLLKNAMHFVVMLVLVAEYLVARIDDGGLFEEPITGKNWQAGELAKETTERTKKHLQAGKDEEISDNNTHSDDPSRIVGEGSNTSRRQPEALHGVPCEEAPPGAEKLIEDRPRDRQRSRPAAMMIMDMYVAPRAQFLGGQGDNPKCDTRSR